MGDSRISLGYCPPGRSAERSQRRVPTDPLQRDRPGRAAGFDPGGGPGRIPPPWVTVIHYEMRIRDQLIECKAARDPRGGPL